MSPLVYILAGIVLVLSLFLVLPFLFRPKYSVVKRLRSLSLTNELSSIRISTVVIKASGKNRDRAKGLFVFGARSHISESSLIDYSEVFPISEQEVDEMLTLLKSQKVFAVTWRKKRPVKLSIDGVSGEIKLVFKRFRWLDYNFIVDMEDGDIANLLKMFEELKAENDLLH